MTGQKFDVNKLRIASPCSVGWENMSGDEKTRFCKLCSLSVYNISELSGAEAQKLIKKTEGRICGRIYRRADGTVITKDCPVGLRAFYKRTARFAGAALASIIGLFSVGFGQSNSKKAQVCKETSQFKILRTETKNESNIVEGTITDANGAVVPGVKITLTNLETKQTLQTTTDENGYYSFSSPEAGKYTLRGEVVNFKTFEFSELNINKNESLRVSTNLEVSSKTTVIVGMIANEPSIDFSSTSVTHTIKPNRFPY
ncbi:MAG: carboxypeptidase-like regulatory domain-containing protein [Pyrinomonadaceae bacterium]